MKSTVPQGYDTIEENLVKLSAVVLGCPDPPALARFYRDLLAWELTQDEPGWAQVRPFGGGPGLSFQREADHVPPVWPAEAGQQQMQMHLDVGVDDLPRASDLAVRLGATVAATQPEEGVLVHTDPAGHVFCLFLPGH